MSGIVKLKIKKMAKSCKSKMKVMREMVNLMMNTWDEIEMECEKIEKIIGGTINMSVIEGMYIRLKLKVEEIEAVMGEIGFIRCKYRSVKKVWDMIEDCKQEKDVIEYVLGIHLGYYGKDTCCINDWEENSERWEDLNWKVDENRILRLVKVKKK